MLRSLPTLWAIFSTIGASPTRWSARFPRLLGLVWGWFRLKRWSISRAHWSWLWGLACVGTGFHIFADSWNSYGVHPFWPIDNAWYYGDCVFILEPTLWLLLLPATAAQTRLYRWRALAAFLGVGILALGLSTGFTTPLAAAALGTATFGWTVILRRLRPQAQSLATALGLLVLLAFWKTTATYAKHVIAQSPEVLARGTLLDISTAPFPAHPICWQVSLSQVSTDGALYRVRSGTLSLAPGLVAASKCPSRTGESPLSTSSQWAWFSEFEGSVTDLKAHAKQCRAEAFLRFARMPVWTRTTMTDARFFRGARFPHLDLSSTECPSYVPPWEYPLSNHREHFDLNQ